jgi:hypothetical protein
MVIVHDSQTHVNITKERYIQFLEAENALYRIQEKMNNLDKPSQAPSSTSILSTSCHFNAVTNKIRLTGKTVKQWAKNNGFKPDYVRMTICGFKSFPVIRQALVKDGFMEVAP